MGHSLIKAAILAGALGLSAPVWADSGARSAFQRQRLQLIAQNGKECGPVSLFNSLAVSTAGLGAPIAQLPGRFLRDKYDLFLQQYGIAQGRWSAADGIGLNALVDMANEFAGGPFAGIRAASPAQSAADLVRSADEGFLPVVQIGFRSPDDKYLTGHALIFLSVDAADAQTVRISAYDSESYRTIKMALTQTAGSRIAVEWLNGPPHVAASVPVSTFDGYLVYRP
jgi:hypothetical protein